MKVKELINYLCKQDQKGEIYVEDANRNESFEIEEVTNGAKKSERFTVLFIERIEE